MPSRTQTLSGLDLVERYWPKDLRGARVGLVAHPASVNRRIEHAIDVFRRSKRFRLAALFGPQHGILGQTQDNMVEWEGFRDAATGLPVYSLYGARRQPSPEQLQGLDALVFDVQDIGTRFYTYISTMGLAMEAAAAAKIRFIVLDRVNPIGGEVVEGPLPEGPSIFTSFSVSPDSRIRSRARSTIFTGSPMSSTRISPPLPISPA